MFEKMATIDAIKRFLYSFGFGGAIIFAMATGTTIYCSLRRRSMAMTLRVTTPSITTFSMTIDDMIDTA
jgi:hypothetical protein